MQWVTDTGPVLHLLEAGADGLLELLGDVALPPAVNEELARWTPGWSVPANLKVVALAQQPAAEAEKWWQAGLIDRGEAQAIALTRQLRADVFLTDDAAARLLAGSLGLQARGSLGVILWLAGQRKISNEQAALFLENLARTSLWVSSSIMAEARAALAKIGKP